MLITKFRKYSLALAESFDAWRIVPRTILIMYSALVLNLYLWFKSIPTFVQERCDASMLKLLLDSKIDLEQAKTLACSIVDVVGGPTAAQSAFVTTITGLSAGIFGLYTATGRRWDGGLPVDINRRFTYEQPAPTVNPTENTSDESPPSPRNQMETGEETVKNGPNGPTI
jgi:hypothetical protein